MRSIKARFIIRVAKRLINVVLACMALLLVKMIDVKLATAAGWPVWVIDIIIIACIIAVGEFLRRVIVLWWLKRR